jgi:hypothetical protein
MTTTTQTTTVTVMLSSILLLLLSISTSTNNNVINVLFVNGQFNEPAGQRREQTYRVLEYEASSINQHYPGLLRYYCTFRGKWSAERHPNDFPSSPSWSAPIIVSHSKNYRMWTGTETVTAGVEYMAEVSRNILCLLSLLVRFSFRPSFDFSQSIYSNYIQIIFKLYYILFYSILFIFGPNVKYLSRALSLSLSISFSIFFSLPFCLLAFFHNHISQMLATVRTSTVPYRTVPYLYIKIVTTPCMLYCIEH